MVPSPTKSLQTPAIVYDSQSTITRNQKSYDSQSSVGKEAKYNSQASIGKSNSDTSLPTFYSLSSTSRALYISKNKEIHKLFPTLPNDDCYVGEAVCALQKEILRQGKLYLTERHFCFTSNIFGYVTTEVIPISLVQRIEKVFF
jgi:hypothetical protein